MNTKSLLIYLSFSVLFIGITGCNKDDDSPTDSPEYFIEGSIGGDFFQYTELSGSINYPDPIFPQGTGSVSLTIIVHDEQDSSIFWNIGLFGTGNPYAWDLPKSFPGALVNTSPDAFSKVVLVPPSGTAMGNCEQDGTFELILTRFDNRTFEGTFSGTVYIIDSCASGNLSGMKQLTGGRFRVKV